MTDDQRRQRRSVIILAVAIGLFCLYFGAVNWFRHVNLMTSQYDMGNMDQTVWHTLHGRFFQMSDPGTGQLVSRASYHTDYLLLLYVPFYVLWPDPRTMLVLQVLLVASGALPLFWYARKKVGITLATILVVLYLLYPPQQWGMIFDVHAVVIVAPIVLWAWWAMSERRWWIYAAMIVLAVLGKEEVGLAVAGIGLFWVWRKEYRTAGILTMLLGIGTTLTMLGIVIPHYRHGAGHFALNEYAQFGDSYGAIIGNLALHPWRIFPMLISHSTFAYTALILLPLAGISLIGLPILLIALPELLINTLSSYSSQQSIFYQYTSVIIPFVFLAAVDGWARLDRWWQRRNHATLLRRPAFLLVILSGSLLTYIYSPIPGLHHGPDAIHIFQANPYRAAVAASKQFLHPDDTIVATNNIIPHYSQRKSIWGFPHNIEAADAVIVLEGGEFEFEEPAVISARVQALTADPQFTLVMHQDQFWLFRRVVVSQN